MQESVNGRIALAKTFPFLTDFLCDSFSSSSIPDSLVANAASVAGALSMAGCALTARRNDARRRLRLDQEMDLQAIFFLYFSFP